MSNDKYNISRAQEARLLAALNHSNIAAIHGIEESAGRKFLAMELAAACQVKLMAWVDASSG